MISFMLSLYLILILLNSIIFVNCENEKWSVSVEDTVFIDSYTDDGNSMFGVTTSIYEDYAIVGASFSRKAYIFHCNNGVWNSIADTAILDYTGTPSFGSTVAIGELYAAVGAFERSRVFIYDKSDNKFSTTAFTILEDSDNTGDFGASIAIYDESILIGSNIKRQAKLYTRSTLENDDHERLFIEKVIFAVDEADFGVSVALSNDIAVIGANLAKKVYIYGKKASKWDTSAKHTIDDYTDVSGFGTSVAIALNSQDTIIVGAPNAEKVFFFERVDNEELAPGTWTSTATKIFQHTEETQYGISVGIDPYGLAAIVGAPGAERAELFYKVNNAWNDNDAIDLNQFVGTRTYGRSVSMHGTSFIVGADGAGNAFIYHREWEPIPIVETMEEDTTSEILVPIVIGTAILIVLIIFGVGIWYETKYSARWVRWWDQNVDKILQYMPFGRSERRMLNLDTMRMLGVDDLQNLRGDPAVGDMYLRTMSDAPENEI